jgi:3-oxoacid CoA-transferase subunit B
VTDIRVRIAQRVARELKDGDCVNLGIGLPTLLLNFIPEGVDIITHTENGMLGDGGFPREDEVDPDLINAGKETVMETKGSSYFSGPESFAMIRNRHIDVAILGALQVDRHGNLANWTVPGRTVEGMGSDGSRRRRKTSHRGDGAQDARGRAQDRRAMLAASDRTRCR